MIYGVVTVYLCDTNGEDIAEDEAALISNTVPRYVVYPGTLRTDKMKLRVSVKMSCMTVDDTS